jgi:hypothetical protein
MDSPNIHHKATNNAIVEAYLPPTILGAPMEAKQEPRLLFVGSQGLENSPNRVRNGP